MKYFTILVTVTALAVASPVKCTVAQVETDLKDIFTQMANLDNSIKAFPDSGGSFSSALSIHTASQKLVSSLNMANTDVKGTTNVTDSDGQTIQDLVKNSEPAIIDALNNIVTKKAAFDNLPLGGVSFIVKKNLGQLRTATEALETSLFSRTPASLKSQAQEIQSSVDAAFAKAQAAYA
ncbi:hydrophobic surface binding protein [Dendrothele bispora CBS 962.96]|uniref:Hydrophobic surface binding protein n=1 Tax=Dendrothele bispora (strain CBS 962.96) TaxID=1314807 RepID=A0A4S8KMX2_DENBC|nr:hydrophobic surface binding protein [Dendrothele bispora CBS 962.96]